MSRLVSGQLVAPFLAVKLGPGQMDKLRRCWGGIASWLLRFQHDTSQWLNKPWDALVAAFKDAKRGSRFWADVRFRMLRIRQLRPNVIANLNQELLTVMILMLRQLGPN